jgi:(1->4)-alpha-D-glucan 1-alpha-D-glucosylmutase
LHAEFTFDDAAAVTGYLAELGVSHMYCSPYLAAAPGSRHGYDVVDHSRLNPELGGEAGFERFVAACRDAGLGLILDVVPNHVAVSAPESLNTAWWEVLRDGPQSRYADWFDIDWDSPDNPGKVLVPILGGPLAESMADLQVDGDRIRYFEHDLPLAAGSLVEGDLPATLARQHYRLCHWRTAVDELNYRRFFDVTTLAGLRVENADVYLDSHRLILDQVRAGVLDGLRIDHPDGLADPAGYLDRLAADTGGSWVVVEKILEHGEELPAWACAGTTGYDALNRINGLFVDASEEAAFSTLYREFTGETDDFDQVVEAAKRQVVSDVLAAEVSRLAALVVAAAWEDPSSRDYTRRGLHEGLVELLVAFDVYRAYVPATGAADPTAVRVVERAAALAVSRVPRRAAEIDVVARLVLTGPAELRIRFAQTCGPVMAKGVEDTAFYRYHRLSGLNEVGGNSGRFGVSPDAFHRESADAQEFWPLAMTTLSTHDTKRSEDVRARLATVSQDPAGFSELLAGLLALGEPLISAAGPDRNLLYLLVQTLVGAWPIDADRLVRYLEKASREAKVHTSWTEPDPEYDAALIDFARGLLADPEAIRLVERYVASIDAAAEVTGMSQKLVQLLLPGIPDVYQGTETRSLRLVDPDNRQPVDYPALRASLADGTDPKQRVVRTALALRRAHPDWFGSQASYRPLPTPDSVAGFIRSDAVLVLVPRLWLRAQRGGGWGEQTLTLPEGRWRDQLTDRDFHGAVPIADLLAGTPPVALLVRLDVP